MDNKRRECGITLSTGRRRVSYLLKCIVVVSAAAGVILSAMAGAGTFMGGSRVFMYFTIQSNIAIGLICLVGGLLPAAGRKPGYGWHVIKLTGTVSITLTGAVFCFVLAPTLGRHSWNVQNILTHVVVPIAAIADLFVTGTRGALKRSSAFYGTLPPLAYAVYAGIGYAAGWEFSQGHNYPYFFLNWGSPAGAFGFTGELPFMGCGWWLIGLFILVYLVGLAYVEILNRTNINDAVEECRGTPGAVLLDVREADEFRSGHIPGAVSAPLSAMDTTALPVDRPLYVYCLRGTRSRRAVGLLRRKGYDARSIGGIASYRGRLER